MGRWTQYDEDEYRLPEGMIRTGYDADTGQYTFKDRDGSTWQSAPGNAFGKLTVVTPGQPSSSSKTPGYYFDDSGDSESDDDTLPEYEGPPRPPSKRDEKRRDSLRKGSLSSKSSRWPRGRTVLGNDDDWEFIHASDIDVANANGFKHASHRRPFAFLRRTTSPHPVSKKEGSSRRPPRSHSVNVPTEHRYHKDLPGIDTGSHRRIATEPSHRHPKSRSEPRPNDRLDPDDYRRPASVKLEYDNQASQPDIPPTPPGKDTKSGKHRHDTDLKARRSQRHGNTPPATETCPPRDTENEKLLSSKATSKRRQRNRRLAKELPAEPAVEETGDANVAIKASEDPPQVPEKN